MTWFQKPPLATPLDWGNSINKGTVLHLAMNEGHGNVVRDLSMYGNHGTLKGCSWTDGGVRFNGTTDYITIPNFVLTFPATILLRINPANLTATSITFLSRNGDTSFVWYHRPSVPGIISIYEGDDNDGSAGVLQENIWQLVGLTFDAAGNGHHWYNGNQDTAFSTIVEPTNPFELRIGEWSNYDFHGTMSDVKVCNRALSAAEIKSYYINPWQVYLDD